MNWLPVRAARQETGEEIYLLRRRMAAATTRTMTSVRPGGGDRAWLLSMAAVTRGLQPSRLPDMTCAPSLPPKA